MDRKDLEKKTRAELLEMARRKKLAGAAKLLKEELVDALLGGPKVKTSRATAAPKARPKAKPAPKAKAKAKAKAPAAAKVAPKPAARPAKARPKVSERPKAEAPRTGAPAWVPPTVSVVEKPTPPRERRVPGGAPLRMPEKYGVDFAALMVRDPFWLHAYWEVTPAALERAERDLGGEWPGHRRVLRVDVFPEGVDPDAAESAHETERFDIDLAPGAENWYIHVAQPERAYRVSVGILTRSGRFFVLARSNLVRTPRDRYSQVTDEEWTAPPEMFAHLYETLRNASQLKGSEEFASLLRERMSAEWSSGMMGSMASGQMARPEARPEGFWFHLDTELIVYGATEPDARVAIQGKAVALRPDGTFTLRFQLPDGQQVIDATAVSKNGRMRKTITPTVSRRTTATDVEKTGRTP